MSEEKIRRSADALLEGDTTLDTAIDQALYRAWGEAWDRMTDSDVEGDVEKAGHWRAVADLLEARGRQLCAAADRRVEVRHDAG